MDRIPDKDWLMRQIAEIPKEEYIKFLGLSLGYPKTLIERFRRMGEFTYSVKRMHLLDTFKRNRRAFVDAHLNDLTPEYRRKYRSHVNSLAEQHRRAFVDANITIPDLTGRDVCGIVKKYEKSDWMKVMLEKFNYAIPEDDFRIAPRALTKDMKTRIISSWIEDQSGTEEAAWTDLYERFQHFVAPVPPAFS